MKSSSLFNPRAGRITLSLLAVVALLMAMIVPAFVAVGPQRAIAQGGSTSDTGTISVFKTLVTDIGEQDTPQNRDTSLDGFEIDFLVFAGETNTGTPVDTITVTLGQNDKDAGNVGDGSQGRKTSIELEPGTFTVCEVPVATNPETGETVPLDAEPRPEAGNGGSTGGAQLQTFENCVQVVVTTGNAEVKFLDEVMDEEPSPSPSPSPSPEASPSPSPEASPSPSPEASPSPIPDGQTPDNGQEGDKDTDTGGGKTPDTQTDTGGGKDTGGGDVQDDTQTDTGGGDVQDDTQTDTGGGDVQDDTQTDSGGGDVQDDTQTDSGGGDVQDDTQTDTGGGDVQDDSQDDTQDETPADMPDTGAGGMAGGTSLPLASLGYLGTLLTLVGGTLMVRRKR